eukprot:TRINITY_DN56722_c0_g1_i1.p1 TRINITY_DN56722_c0_g1~~TRINITY_DN56722_c0_g1_i1.p1  ORF type:complete len:202 (-),score=32.93 TRINITY_DN56722_c0_g1_i1:30-635(-)
MAVDICCMQECLRWDGVAGQYHLTELEQFDEFNYYISEYFEPPAPAVATLDALAILMGWTGKDTKQIVTAMTGQRHTDDEKCTAHFKRFLAEMKERSGSQLGEVNFEQMRAKLTENIAQPKYNHEAERYDSQTPMNSYDVLKCSQACFHLFEWLSSLISTRDRPPRFLPLDLRAFREKEAELRSRGLWPGDPPVGPAARDV